MNVKSVQKPIKAAGPSPVNIAPLVKRSRGQGRIALLTRLGWGVASVSLFAGMWEAVWAVGGLNPLLLPPPHIFLANFAAQAQYFMPTNVIGQVTNDTALLSLVKTIFATAGRVLAGLALGFILSSLCGMSICYFRLFGKLMLPTITLLAPISPIAWLPVAIFIFGIGNPPAIFMVFISLFFVMTISTISQIESVSKTFLDVAAVMGASRVQTFCYVILPAILPALFFVLRMNLFGAWMIVLVAEATGVGSGLGQIVMQARNTFNSSLSFFTMTIIGMTGFAFDVLLRNVQKKLLYWMDSLKSSWR